MKGKEDIYELTLEKMWNISSSRYFSNGKPEHARMILESFLRHAQTKVNLLCKNLNSDVFNTNSLKNALNDALMRNIEVNILYQDDISSLQTDLKDFVSKGLHLNQANGFGTGMNINFATFDGQGFRLEPNRNEPKAKACLNDPKQAQNLDYIFNNISPA